MGSSVSIPDARVVVVGGGYAGVQLCIKLKKDGYNFSLISTADFWHHNLASVRAIVNESKSHLPFIKVLKYYWK